MLLAQNSDQNWRISNRKGFSPSSTHFGRIFPTAINIFTALMPDILHQLHKGVFHAHLVDWCDKLMSAGELDQQFMSMASHPDLRHFSKGITSIKQWTGKKQRAMEHVFVGAVAKGTNNGRVIVAAQSLLNFIYLAQLPCHTSDTLAQMRDALEEFHCNKPIFIENGIRSDFNIPKLHSLIHYVNSITGYGAQTVTTQNIWSAFILSMLSWAIALATSVSTRSRW